MSSFPFCPTLPSKRITLSSTKDKFYQTLKEHKTVLNRVFGGRNDAYTKTGIENTSRDASILCDSLRGLTSFPSSKINRVQFCVLQVFMTHCLGDWNRKTVLYRYSEDSFVWTNYMGS